MSSYQDFAPIVEKVFRKNRLRLAPIRAEHADDLVALVAASSPQSRFLCFHTGIDTLRPAMAEKLANIDPQAGAAFGLRAWHRRLVAEDVAEAIIIISDKYQGRGLGLALLAQAFAHAAAHGIVAIHAEALPSNGAILHVLGKLAPVHHIGYEDGIRHVCLPLTEQPCSVCTAVAAGA